MKITDIRMMRLRGPLVHGQGGATSEMIAKVIVRVDTDAGIYGLGEIDDFMGVREALAYMKQYFMGRDAFEANPIVSELLYASLPPHHAAARHGDMPGDIRAVPTSSPTATPWGPVVWAASGVEMALCDAVGKALGTPVYNLLGGKFRDRVRIYLDRSSPLHVSEPDSWRKMASAAVEAGFTQIKFDIDHVAADCTQDVWNRSLPLGQINRIAERLGLVRETVGADFELCVDCHMHYNAADAIRLALELAPLKLLWLEDPSPIAICVGEMFTAEQFRIFIDHGACDIVHPDVMFAGGLHETRRIADYAELNHLAMAMHGNGGALAAIAAAHVAAASRCFLGLEYHFIETPWIGAFARRDIPLFEEGCIRLTDAPGLGVELDLDVCRRYLAPGERGWE
ncbi:MAG: hypothetical protein DMG07_23215 [Acidobacteria bacterium]|nr:MAG: hypothetical protein DMG07_23215 [Acidobacteriota bacterium]